MTSEKKEPDASPGIKVDISNPPHVLYSNTARFDCQLIENGDNNPPWEFKICSDDSWYKINLHSGSSSNYVLTALRYDCDLYEWLDRNPTIWNYLNVDLPTDACIQLIDSIVKAVFILISEGKQHDFIRNPRNFLILDRVFNHGSRFPNVDFDETQFSLTFKTAVVMQDVDPTYKDDDMIIALDSLIFTTILKEKVHLPEWDHFHSTLLNKPFKYAELHSRFWDSNRRLEIFPRVERWRKGDNLLSNVVISAVRKSTFFQKHNWLQVVRNQGGSFLSVLKYKNMNGLKYDHKPESLIRYLRNFRIHVADKYSNGRYKHLNRYEARHYDLEGERYLDHRITLTFPTLVEELNEELIWQRLFH